MSGLDKSAVIATARANGWSEAMIAQLLAIQPAESPAPEPGPVRKSAAGRYKVESDPVSLTASDLTARENAVQGSRSLLRALVGYARDHHPDSALAALQV